MTTAILRRRQRTQRDLRVFLLLGPVLVYDMGLQVLRIGTRFSEIIRNPARLGTLDWLAMIGSPLLYHFGLALTCAGALHIVSRSVRIRAAVLACTQVICMATVFIETASYVYFVQTESSLDWAQFAYNAARPADLVLVATGMVTPSEWTGLVLLLASVLAAPWIAPPLFREDSPQLDELRHTRESFVAMMIVGAAALTSAFVPLAQPHVVNAAVVRDPVVNLIVTHFSRPELDLAAETAAELNGRPFDLQIRRVRDVPERNVVFIILESTRAKSVTVYNPKLPTTPFLAQLARHSLVAERAYTVVPHTAKALVAIFCGIEPAHTVQALAFKLGLLGRCLPELIDGQGYRSVFFQSANPTFEARIPTTTAMGSDEFVGANRFSTNGFQKANFLGWEDDVMLDPSKEWLAQHRDRPFTAVYLTINAHHDCYPLRRHGHVQFVADQALNDYLNAVRYDDLFIEALLQQYKDLGLYSNTLFVILGDHGEAFGEHGRRTHDDVPYEEGLHIPLLLHDGGGKLINPGHFSTPVNELDLVPTILEVLGYEITRGKVHGTSIFHAQSDRKLNGACFNEGVCLVQIQGYEKYIHHFGGRHDQYFDLRTDPDEQYNLVHARPLRADVKRQELLAWDRHVRALYWANELQSRR